MLLPRKGNPERVQFGELKVLEIVEKESIGFGGHIS
jgi:hypothetical protein